MKIVIAIVAFILGGAVALITGAEVNKIAAALFAKHPYLPDGPRPTVPMTPPRFPGGCVETWGNG